MKNLIIYLMAIMFSGSIALQKNETTKVVPYKVIVENEDGKRFYIPSNLVEIKEEAFNNWYSSPYRGKLEVLIEF
jgi:hypothetical protein